MAKSPNLLDVFERNKYNLAQSARKSRTWFDQQVLLLTRQRIVPKQILQTNQQQIVGNVLPGHMYMFFYDPKTKAKLPYYDTFPMVLPFSKTEDGFIGLNLHYLPYQLRAVLLDRLMFFKNNEKLDETTRLRYSWQMIDGVSKYKLAQPCVKRYLHDHVRSPFRRISSADWGTAMLLPVEQFVGASKQQVWADSKRIAL